MNIFEVLLLQPLANGLVLTYRLLGQNMGLAIIVFSLVLKFALSPLTRPYMESMRKMKQHQKELDKLKKRHKDDKQKQLKAQADFYKEKGIKPGAGCLPYLLQIIILIAFFNVFSRVLTANGDAVAKFNELLYEPLKFASDAIINTRFLYLDITKPDVISGVLPFPIPGPFLILAALVQFVSAKITTPFMEKEKKAAAMTKDTADDIQTSMQQSMVYTFPLITLLIGINFASGLVLYWFAFSASQAYEQYKNSGWGGLTPLVRRLGVIK